MRVTHRTIAATVNFNLQRNLSRLERYANQLSTGKAFHKPSQNPVGVGRVMAFNAAIGRNEQLRLNLNEIRGWLEAGETALSSALNLLQDVRRLSIQAASGAVGEPERHAIALEVEGLFGQLVGLANTEFNGLFIFAGHKTLERPFSIDENGALRYHGDSGQRIQEISAHQEVEMNLSGDKAFGEGAVFDAVARAAAAMRNQDTASLGGETLAALDRVIDLLLQNRSELGARSKRVETMHGRLFTESISLLSMRSQVEDIDVAFTITGYQMQESAYQAALATAARIFQPSLVDFLR